MLERRSGEWSNTYRFSMASWLQPRIRILIESTARQTKKENSLFIPPCLPHCRDIHTIWRLGHR